MPVYRAAAAAGSSVVDESEGPSRSLSRNSSNVVVMRPASHQLLSSASLTQQLEQKSVPADVANTLEHIVGQLDILTQVLTTALSLYVVVILMTYLSTSC